MTGQHDTVRSDVGLQCFEGCGRTGLDRFGRVVDQRWLDSSGAATDQAGARMRYDEVVSTLDLVSGLTQGRDFKLGYSPERINPGDKEHTLERITKVVSGEDAEKK